MNCSICNKILNKNEVLYRSCDDYVCSIRCSNKRFNIISKVDPYFNNPISWNTSNNSHQLGLNLNSISLKEIPIKTTLIKIKPKKNCKPPLIYNVNSRKFRNLTYIYTDLFLNSSIIIVFGFYIKYYIKSLFKQKNKSI